MKTIQFGNYLGVMYPDVYFEFVSKLHREHPDLVRAMVLAQVKLEDGSARDFLNQTFQTNIGPEVSMEEGFKVFLLMLERRNNSLAQDKLVSQLATNRFSQEHQFNYRPEEDIGKPLFPSIEELEDKQGKPK